jgi:hypothetical protein
MAHSRRTPSESRALYEAEIFESLSERSRASSLRDELIQLKNFE